MNHETAQRLFNYMSEEHGVTLLQTDMQAIERILSEPCSRHECRQHSDSPSPMESKKARKHNSPKLQEILDEVTPSEMEQKKAEMEGKTPLNTLVKQTDFVCCAFLDWVNLHTHFYKSPNMKYWYDKSKFYGDKGFTTKEIFELFLTQENTMEGKTPLKGWAVTTQDYVS